MLPKLPLGPIQKFIDENNTSENSKENDIVVKTSIAKFSKNNMIAKNKNIELAIVVIAPENILMPIHVNASFIRLYLSMYTDST